jgi:Leucine-rich repeat (LRR) protein
MYIVLIIDVLGNLTSLEILDLSYNRIKDLNDPENPFMLPSNLTHLYLQNNAIQQIDYSVIANLTNVKEVNFENNQLSHLNKSMIDLIKNGVSIHFKGLYREFF